MQMRAGERERVRVCLPAWRPVAKGRVLLCQAGGNQLIERTGLSAQVLRGQSVRFALLADEEGEDVHRHHHQVVDVVVFICKTFGQFIITKLIETQVISAFAETLHWTPTPSSSSSSAAARPSKSGSWLSNTT